MAFTNKTSVVLWWTAGVAVIASAGGCAEGAPTSDVELTAPSWGFLGGEAAARAPTQAPACAGGTAADAGTADDLAQADDDASTSDSSAVDGSSAPSDAERPRTDPDASCPEGFAGPRCEQKVCETITIRSLEDLGAVRRCGEIQGDLTIASMGLTQISAGDLPFLTTITGDLIIVGAHGTNEPALLSVTLTSLREVGGAIIVAGVGQLEARGSGPLEELHLPALQHIGEHDRAGLVAFMASIKTLDLPSLETIEGWLELNTLTDLCSVQVPRLKQVGGLDLNYLPLASAEDLAPARAAAQESRESAVACCATNAADRVACAHFPEDAHALYCTGC